MRPMNWTLSVALLCSAAVITTASPASALSSCGKDSDCKTAGDVCHGGTCLPKTKQCKADTDCSSHEACDMTCPHGGSATSTTVSVPPSETGTATDGEGQSGSDDSKSEDGEEAGGSGSSGSASSGSGSASGSGGSASSGDGGGTSSVKACPKEVGVCVASIKKVKADAQCQSFCAAAAKCGGMTGGSSSSSSSGGTATPSPTPAPDTEGSSGSDATDTPPSSGAGSGATPPSSGGADDANGDDDGEPSSDGEKKDADADKKAPDGEATDTKTTVDTGACEFMCAVIKLEKVAESEFQAAVKCVTDNASKTCNDIEKTCDKEFDAVDDAMKKDGDKLQVALAGGFGGSEASLSGTARNNEDDKSTGGTNTSGDGGQPASSEAAGNGAAAGAGGATGSAAASGGCTAGFAPRNGATGLMIVFMLLCGAVLLRRQES
ncbi:MAG: hypothetical protein KC502_10460 [Myxococcales bacterium]|nr:hypothetical protein [Myxococcales bacterium]